MPAPATAVARAAQVQGTVDLRLGLKRRCGMVFGPAESMEVRSIVLTLLVLLAAVRLCRRGSWDELS